MIARIKDLVLIAAVCLLAVYILWPREPVKVGQAQALPPAKEVRTVEKVIIKPEIIYVYPPKVKDGLDLPPDVKKDDAKKVTATAKLDAEERPYTLVGVLDTQTGHSEIYARPDPLPLVGTKRTRELGAYYGLADGETAIRIEARQDLLQLKALHVGAIGNVDVKPSGLDTFVGVGVWAKF